MVKNPKRAFVIGWPISHSLSPQLHQFWLKQYGIDGSYEKIAIAPDALEEFMGNLASSDFIGGNVTIPHKETVFALTRDAGPVARKLKAVNTLWVENGQIKSDNTDSYGFAANLDDFAPRWRKAKSALVLGAGGAAKAIIFALMEAGISRITIVNRTPSRAQTLAQQMGNDIQPRAFSQLPTLLADTDLLINTTSLGMQGQPDLEIDLATMAKSSIVTDIVYNPLETQILKQAGTLGLTTVDGIGMLLHQAVPGFEKWFGVRPQVSPDLRLHMCEILKANAT